MLRVFYEHKLAIVKEKIAERLDKNTARGRYYRQWLDLYHTYLAELESVGYADDDVEFNRRLQQQKEKDRRNRLKKKIKLHNKQTGRAVCFICNRDFNFNRVRTHISRSHGERALHTYDTRAGLLLDDI